MAQLATKTDRALEDRMLAHADDEERVDVIGKARAFKRSWIELAEALTRTFDRSSWERWGYEDFDSYCKKELQLTPSTAQKLLGSFRFLKTSAPKIIERSRQVPEAPIPSMRAVDFVARAQERGAADAKAMAEIRRAAFDEGAEAPLLSRRFKTIAFPVSVEQKETKLRQQIASTARRLAHLIAEPGAAISHDIATDLEEALGRLLEALDS